MKLFTISKQSIRAILSNKARSSLTILGIVIGIGSVISLMGLGDGIKSYISGQINALGTTNITVTSGSGGVPRPPISFKSDKNNNDSSTENGSGPSQLMGSTSTLTQKDLDMLNDKKTNPKIGATSGSINSSGIYNFKTHFGVSGVSEKYFDMQDLKIDKGQFFSETNYSNKDNVAVLGEKEAIDLFENIDPIGKTLKIQSDEYTIIGVLEHAKESKLSNPNAVVYIPSSSAMKTLAVESYSNLSAKAIDESSVDQAKLDIEKTLLANHGIKDIKLADFTVVTSADLLSTVSSIASMLTGLISAIAAISLLVGGIGIMNIMLVSVTERTREIGLRKAVGAKTSDILVQFLIEALILTIFGGIIGIAFGAALGSIAGKFIGFDAIISESSILMAVGISGFIGILFGVYPAVKAASLNPIDALRYE